jgi:hypothetical protein
MPVYQYIQQMLQEQAKTADIQAETQQRIQQIMLSKKQMQEQDTSRAILSALQTDQAQRASPPSDDPIANLQQNSQDLRQRGAKMIEASSQLRSSGGDMRLAAEMEKEGVALDRESRLLASEAAQEQKTRIAEIGALAANATDEDTFAAVLPEVRKLNPTFGMKGNFDRDTTGEVMWGPKTAQSMKAMANAAKTAGDRIREQTAQDTAQLRRDQLEERRQEARAREADRQTAHALLQAGAADRAELTRARIAELNAKTEAERAKADAEKKKVDAAKTKALRPVTAEEKRTAEAAIVTHEKFIDPTTNKAIPWEAGSQDAFRSAVAARAKTIYAENLASDPDYSMDDAYIAAVEKLSPFVHEKVTRSSGRDIVDKINPFLGKELVYRRGDLSEGKVRESESTTTFKPGVTDITPTNADDYLKSIGLRP